MVELSLNWHSIPLVFVGLKGTRCKEYSVSVNVGQTENEQINTRMPLGSNPLFLSLALPSTMMYH